MIVTIVPNEHITKAWLLAEPYLRKAVDLVANRVDTTHIFEGLMKNDYQLWVIFDEDKILGAFVTHIVDHPKARGINVPYLGGDEHRITEWFDQAVANVEDFARINGCTVMEFIGREGWVKYLKAYGYKKAMCIFEKEL
jgi:hypothetical protein